MDEKYFIQKSSFMYILVKSENSNPDWSNKPFEVIEKTKFDEIQRQLDISNQQLKLGELLNNDLQKEVDRLNEQLKEALCVLRLSADTLHLSRCSIGYEAYCESLNKFFIKLEE